jgi:hypothetical protein
MRVAFGIAFSGQGFLKLLYAWIFAGAGEFEGAFEDRLFVHAD